MRHQKQGKKLGRKKAPRKALLRSQAIAFLSKGSIVTTEIKAKQLRSFAEKLISRGRKDNLSNRRYLLAKLNSRKIVDKIIKEISPRYQTRPGGYCRLIKLGKRPGDNSPKVKIELIIDNEQTEAKKSNKKPDKK